LGRGDFAAPPSNFLVDVAEGEGKERRGRMVAERMKGDLSPGR